MRRLRFSMIHLMAVLAVLALDMAVIRSLNRYIPGSNGLLYLVPIDGIKWIPFATFALGVLPMASLLVLVTISQLMAIRGTGDVSPSCFGFLAFGCLSIFLFMCGASLSPPALQDCLLRITGVINPAILAVNGNKPTWLLERIYEALDILIFTLPELAIAMGGGWLTGRWGSRVRAEMVSGTDLGRTSA